MKPITDIMREIRRGRGVELATDMLAEVVRAVRETNKKGSITIDINVAPDESGDNQMTVTMACKSKVPRPSIPDAIFYADEEGALHRNDPGQTEMFRAVGEGEERTAATG